MTYTGLVNLLMERGMSYKEATRKARQIEEKVDYLRKVLGADITVADVLESEC